MTHMITTVLTNDDGFQSTGVRVLYAALKSIKSKVRIILPASNASGKGSAITVTTAIAYRQVTNYSSTEFDDLDSTDVVLCADVGTPVDCVKIGTNTALCGYHNEAHTLPDLVVAGINSGPNIGPLANYSATLAAAREGCVHGIPSIAFSVDDYGFHNEDFKGYYTRSIPYQPDEARENIDAMQRYIVKIINFVLDPETRLPKGTFLNVNFPAETRKAKGIKIVENFPFFTISNFTNINSMYGGLIKHVCLDLNADNLQQTEDITSIKENYITITPMKIENFDSEYSRLLTTNLLQNDSR